MLDVLPEGRGATSWKGLRTPSDLPLGGTRPGARSADPSYSQTLGPR